MTAGQDTRPDTIEAPPRPVEDGEPSPVAPRPRRRWWRRISWLSLVPLLVATTAAGTAWGVTPSVADAPRRVAALAALNRAVPLAGALPDRVAAAVLAVEDHRFYRHRGIDALALPRAVGGVLSGGDAGGATIEVQLAKWLYTGGRRDHLDQAEQIALAAKLDLAYSKRQILLMYLNTVYFGHDYYGVTAASHGYFGLDPDRLDWAQAALLAGVLKAPDYFDPRDHPAEALDRRDYVLRRLAAVGGISDQQRTAAQRSGLGLAPG